MSRDTGQKRRDNAATYWLSVAEVSRLEGIAPRTVQRRCTAGKYTFRTLETANGPRFEIDADSLKNGAATEPKNAATTPRQNDTFAATNAATRRDNSDQNAATNAERIAELKAEVAFLRNVVEAQQRDAVETRQALKRALDLAPKQLTTGAAPDGQQRAQTGAAGNHSHADAATPQKQAKRETATDWNSIYGQIADELEAQELNP